MLNTGDDAIYQGRTVKVRGFIEGIEPKYDLYRIEWFDYRGHHQEIVGASELKIAKISGLDDCVKDRSPMPTKMKPIKITEEQDAAIENLVTAAGDKSFSHLVRRLLKEEAERLSVTWPDNMPTFDQNIRKAIDKRWKQDEDNTP
jgi:predicted CopG family antitoxin